MADAQEMDAQEYAMSGLDTYHQHQAANMAEAADMAARAADTAEGDGADDCDCRCHDDGATDSPLSGCCFYPAWRLPGDRL